MIAATTRPSLATIVAFGSALATIAMGFWVRSVYDDEVRVHASDCESKSITAQSVQNFWSRTHDHRAAHAMHERLAANVWIKRNNAEIANVWELLAEDDDANAIEASNYAHELRADFDKECGVAPTAEP